MSGIIHAPLLIGCAQFVSLTTIYLSIALHELRHRRRAFCTRAIDCRGRATPICIDSLAKTFKENENLDHENKTSDGKDAGKNHIKFYKPRFLDDSKWNPDNAIQTTTNHFTDIVCVPNNDNNTPTTKFLFSVIRKTQN